MLGSTELVLPEDLPEALQDALPPAGKEKRSYYEAVKEAKRRLILQALQESGGSYTEAAKLLGMGVNYLHRLVNSLDLRSMVRKEP